MMKPACAPTAHQWHPYRVVTMGLPDAAGRYALVKIYACKRCHRAACEICEVNLVARTSRVTDIGYMRPDGHYQEVSI